MKTSAALIIGYTIQGLAIARSLARSGIPVYVIEKNLQSNFILNSSPLAFTKHATMFVSDRLLGSDLIDSLLDFRGRIPEEQVVLFPASDNTVRVLAKDWDKLNGQYLLSWSNCRPEVSSIIQKGALPQYCEDAGILYPKTVTVQSEIDIERVLEIVEFPVLVKPNKPASSFKTEVCRERGELAKFLRKESENWPLVVQEWIDGSDDCLFAYTCLMDRGREVYGVSSRKVRASPPGLGRATVVQTFNDAGVKDESRKLFEILPISGPVATEFKRDADGRYWFIEANVGRTEYCVDLAIESGFDIPVLEFHLALGLPIPDQAFETRQVVWYDTEKEPFSFLAYCAQQRKTRPFGKRPIFPYLGREGALVNLIAFLNIISDFSRRLVTKMGGSWSKIR